MNYMFYKGGGATKKCFEGRGLDEIIYLVRCFFRYFIKLTVLKIFLPGK